MPTRDLSTVAALLAGLAVRLEPGTPGAVYITAPPSQRRATVRAARRRLEDAGYDIATRGPVGADYVAVFGQEGH